MFYVLSVDCKLSPWSTCSKMDGQQGQQNRSIEVAAKKGGKSCIGPIKRACGKCKYGF